MADEEKEEVGGEDEGMEEEEAVIIKPDEKEEEEEEKEEEEDEGDDEEEVEEKPDFKSMLDSAKEEWKAELEKMPKEQEKKGYTEVELDEAEDKLEAMLENEEIGRVEYRRYMRNIQKIRADMREGDIESKIIRKQVRESSEKAITRWAEENAPDLANPRTKEYRDGVTWAKDTLGVEKGSDGNWVIPAKVAPIMFGILHKGQKGGDEAEKKGYEKGVQDKEARRKELSSRDTKVPKSKKTTIDAPATATEKKVMGELGLKNLKLYRKMKGSGEKGAVVEVGN